MNNPQTLDQSQTKGVVPSIVQSQPKSNQIPLPAPTIKKISQQLEESNPQYGQIINFINYGQEQIIDQQVLIKLKFQQISERKSWQGINVHYSGIPGTSSLNPQEGILMFQQEKGEVEATDKVVDIFREIYDTIQQLANKQSVFVKQEETPTKSSEYSITNASFIRFKFSELLQKQGQTLDYSENLQKKINQVPNSSSCFSMMSTSQPWSIQGKQFCLYKMLKCESKLVRFILEINGLKPTDRHDWNMLWTHTQGKNYFYERLNQFQKINHFPQSTELTRKDKLCVNIKKMQDKYSRTYFNFIPETFVLPDQLSQFTEYFNSVEQKINQSNQNFIISGSNQQQQSKALKQNLWIVKPSCSSRGRGIYIIDKVKNAPQHDNCIVSRYIDSPLLLFGHKFDLRIYVVITSYEPLKIYVYREGLVRIATEKYDISKYSDEKKFSHLTNYSINKKNENYVQNENAEEDDSGFKWSLSALTQYFEELGIDVNLMWAKIYDVIIKSILSIEENIKTQIKKNQINRNNCYELFGYDILLDNQLNPWLLEINLSPSLAFDSPLDLKIKGNLLKDTFNLIGVKRPDQQSKCQGQEGNIRRFGSMQRTNVKDQGQQEYINQICQDMIKQIKNIDEINWVQKEYLNSFILLSQKQKEIVIETLLEVKRRGNFVRIYPTKNSDFYDCFIQQNKNQQQVIYNFLYSEVFQSFRDIKKSSQVFKLKNNFQQKTPKIYNQMGSDIQIMKEMLHEYTNRLYKLMKSQEFVGSPNYDTIIELNKLFLINCKSYGIKIEDKDELDILQYQLQVMDKFMGDLKNFLHSNEGKGKGLNFQKFKQNESTNVQVTLYSWKVIHTYGNDTLIKQIDKYFKNIGVEAKKFLYFDGGSKAVIEILEQDCKKKEITLKKSHKSTLNSENTRVVKDNQNENIKNQKKKIHSKQGSNHNLHMQTQISFKLEKDHSMRQKMNEVTEMRSDLIQHLKSLNQKLKQNAFQSTTQGIGQQKEDSLKEKKLINIQDNFFKIPSKSRISKNSNFKSSDEYKDSNPQQTSQDYYNSKFSYNDSKTQMGKFSTQYNFGKNDKSNLVGKSLKEPFILAQSPDSSALLENSFSTSNNNSKYQNKFLSAFKKELLEKERLKSSSQTRCTKPPINKKGENVKMRIYQAYGQNEKIKGAQVLRESQNDKGRLMSAGNEESLYLPEITN